MTIRRISEISSDPRIQELLTQYDSNHDASLSTEEVDANHDEFLDFRPFQDQWNLEQRNQVQNALFTSRLISQRTIETLEVTGDPQIGTITWLRQIHNDPAIPHSVARHVGDYQFRMLRYSLEHYTRDFFDEELLEDVSPQLVEEIFGSEYGARNLQLLFGDQQPPTEIPNRLSDDLRLRMGRMGMRRYMLFFHRDAHFYRVSNPEEARRFFPELNGGTPHDFTDTLLQNEREAAAARQIFDFLEHNPGVRVFLLYGMEHQFSDDFNRGPRSPRVTSIAFPDLERQHDEALLRVIQENQPNIEEVEVRKQNLRDFINRILNLGKVGLAIGAAGAIAWLIYKYRGPRPPQGPSQTSQGNSSTANSTSSSVRRLGHSIVGGVVNYFSVSEYAYFLSRQWAVDASLGQTILGDSLGGLVMAGTAAPVVYSLAVSTASAAVVESVSVFVRGVRTLANFVPSFL